MRRLSGMDAAFLYLENAGVTMQVQAIMLLDPSTVPGGYSFEKVKAHLAERLPLLPEFRQRLAFVPFDLHRPVWFHDPDFDLDYHVRHIAVPEPGTIEQLMDVIGGIAGRQLDRSRPLWEFWIIEGIENGAVALFARMHHATIDGVSGASLATSILDLEPAPTAPPPIDDWEPEHRPSDFELVRHALESRLRRPVALGHGAGDAEARPQHRERRADPSRPGPADGRRAADRAAHRLQRAADAAPSRRDRVGVARRGEGDQGRARLHRERRRARHRDGRAALVPPEHRRAAGPAAPRVVPGVDPRRTTTTSRAPTRSRRCSCRSRPTSTTRRHRVEALRIATRGAKEEHNAVGARTIMELGELGGPRTFGLASRLLGGLAARGPVPVNVVISNVPGPPFPLYLAGARLVSMLPLGPPIDGAGLNITVLSYIDRIDWGFIVCRELAPHFHRLPDAIPDAHAELRKLAGV